MKCIYFAIIIICLLICKNKACAQKLDSVALAKIGYKLIQQELKNADSSYKTDDHCLRDADDHFLSCYYAESKVNWVTDFNNDGNNDALFHFMDEGLGGGGNAFGYDYRIVLLDANQNIINDYEIFGGGKFSYGQLTVDKVLQGKIYATYEENPMSRDPNEGTENLASVPLVFYYDNDRVREAGYAKCPLAAMKDKKVFKRDAGLKIDSAFEMDSQYNEECWEKMHLPDSTVYNGSISGCEDLEIYFSRTLPFNPNLKKSAQAAKQQLLAELLLLKDKTIFKTIISNTYVKLNTNNQTQLKVDQYGETAIHLSLPDSWSAHLFVSGNKEQGTFITIRFDKPKYATQMDFWQSMKSRNILK